MRFASALAVLLLAACAAPAPPPAPVAAAVRTERVTVVPALDGHIGAVVVRANGQAQVLDSAYATRQLRPDGTVEHTRLSAESVRESFARTLEALPGRPTSYLLYFLEGKDELTRESRAELDKVFADLKARPAPDIVVIGHTDTVGTLAYNDRLSLARADRLRQMLVALGIPAERVQSAGRGKREPLVATGDNVAEPRNRRVEISVR